MHRYDIEDALDRRDAHGLQHAFRMLLDYPRLGVIGGVHTGGLDGLLDQVASGLLLDQTPMPPSLRDHLERVTGLCFDAEATYANAAMAVFEFRARWRLLDRAAAA